MTGNPVNLLLRIRVRDGADPVATADELTRALGLDHSPDPGGGPAAAPASRAALSASGRAALPQPRQWSSLMSFSSWRNRTALEPPDGTDAELWRINHDTFYFYHCSKPSNRIPADPIAPHLDQSYQEFFLRVLHLLGTLPVDVEILARARSGQPREHQRSLILPTDEPTTRLQVVQHNADPTFVYLMIDHSACGRFAVRATVAEREQTNGNFLELAIDHEVTFSPHDRETARIIDGMRGSFHDLADHYTHHRYCESALTWLATVAPTQGRPQDEPAVGLDFGTAGATVEEASGWLGLQPEQMKSAVDIRALFGYWHGNYDPWDIVVTQPSRTDWAWAPQCGPHRLDPHHIAFKYWLSVTVDGPNHRHSRGRRGADPADARRLTWNPADEDILARPRQWSSPLHPRRGGQSVPIEPPRADAGLVVKSARAARADIVVRAGESAEADGELIQALDEYESGHPTPLGGAVQAALVLSKQVNAEEVAVAFADWWTVRSGLSFAACAAVELTDIVVRDVGGGGRTSAPGRIEVRRDEDNDVFGPQPFRSQGPRAALHRVRTLLAVEPDSVYRQTMEQLAAHRRRGWPRIAASYLVPTRTDWVDECCHDPGRVGAGNGEARLLLLSSLSKPAQAVAFGHCPLDRRHFRHFPLATLHTLVDGMGPACIPVLSGLLENPDLLLGRPAEQRAAEILAALPYDRAMTALLRLAPAIEFSPLVAEALTTYPVRGLRLLCESAEGSDIAARPPAQRLLSRHLAEHRETLSPLLAGLPPEQRDLALKLLAEHDRQPPQSPQSHLPTVLREPLWSTAESATTADHAAHTLLAALSPVPEWLDAAVLPPIRTRHGAAVLPAGAISNLIRWVQLGSHSKPRLAPEARQIVESAIDDIEAFCDPASLARYFTALFEHTDTARHAHDYHWVLDGVGCFGDDASAWRFTHWVQRNLEVRPAEAERHGFHLTAEPLARMDSPYSRLCQEAVCEWTGLGVPSGRLAHRLAAEGLETCRIPRVGWDAASGSVLDFAGSGLHTVFFTGLTLTPHLEDEQGRPVPRPPWPARPFDETLSATHEQFHLLAAEAGLLAKTVARRLERAMISGRTWALPTFLRDYVDNRLLRYIASTVLWQAKADPELIYFRITEDGAFHDAHDHPIRLPENAVIGVPHKIRMSSDELAAWWPYFCGPGHSQPFSQLSRAIHRLGAEAADWRTQRTVGRRVWPGFVHSLVRKGWAYGRADKRDGKTRQSVHRVLDDRHTVVFELSPFAPDIPADVDLTAGVLALAAPPRPGHGVVEPRPIRHFADLDELVLSELLADFSALIRF